MKGLRSQTIRGAGWSTIEGAISQGLAFLVFLFMARLLSPTDFGLVALANLYIMVAQYVIFCGLGPAVVQSEEFDEENLDTAFWLQMAIGAGFFGLTLGLPAIIANFFGTLSLTPIVAALSPLFIFSALSSMQNAVLARRLDFRSLAIRTLGTSVLSGAIGVALALRGYGVWSLVWQQLSAGLIQVILLWRISPWRPCFRFSRDKAGRLVRFGMHAMAADLANLVSRRSGQYFVGKFLGPIPSGFFAIAARVSNLISEVIIRSLARVTLASFSRLQEERGRFAAAFYRVVGMQSLLVLPASIGLALLVPEVITVLFGAKWLPAAPAMQLLLLGSIFEALSAVNVSALSSQGRPDWGNYLTLIHLGANLTAFAFAVRWGLEAVALANVIRAAVLYPVELLVLRRMLGISPWRTMLQVLPLLVITIGMALLVYSIQHAVGHTWPAVATLAACICAGAGFFAGALYFIQRPLFMELLGCLQVFRQRGTPSAEVEPAEQTGPVEEATPVANRSITSETRPHTSRLQELDVLRGVAAVWVMFWHYCVHYSELKESGTNGAPNLNGLIPVSLFFLISGFVILLTLNRTRSALDFIVSRFSRLFPVYWVAVILTFSVLTLAPVPGRGTTLGQAIANLTMLQPWLRVPYVDGVYWTLSVELSFYAIMLVLFRMGWLRRLEFFAIPWMVAECGWRVLSQHHSVSWIIEISLLLKFAHLFFAGTVFYRAKTEGWTPLRYAVLLASYCTQFFVHGALAAAFLAGFFIVFFVLVSDRLSFIAVRPLVYLGTISYSLYLIHQNIGYAILTHSHLPHAAGVVLAVAVTVSLASALTWLVERPCQQAIRRFYTRPATIAEPKAVVPAQTDLA